MVSEHINPLPKGEAVSGTAVTLTRMVLTKKYLPRKHTELHRNILSSKALFFRVFLCVSVAK
jgi:hypothetical protein